MMLLFSRVVRFSVLKSELFLDNYRSSSQDLHKMTTLLPKPQQFYINLLINKQIAKHERMSIQRWLQMYSNTKKGNIYNQYSLFAILIATRFRKDKKITNWPHWAYNLFYIKYLNAKSQGRKIQMDGKLYGDLLREINYPKQEQIKSLETYKEPEVSQFMILTAATIMVEKIVNQSQKVKAYRYKTQFITYLNFNIDKIKDINKLTQLLYQLPFLTEKKLVTDKVKFLGICAKLEKHIFDLEETGVFDNEAKLNQKDKYKFLKRLSCFFTSIEYAPSTRYMEFIGKHSLIITQKTLAATTKTKMKIFFSFWQLLPNNIYQNQNGQIIYWKKFILDKFLQECQKSQKIFQQYCKTQKSFLELYLVMTAQALFHQSGVLENETQMIGGCFVIKKRKKIPDLTPYKFQIQVYYDGIMQGYKPINDWVLSLIQDHYYTMITNCDLQALRKIKASEQTMYNYSVDNEANLILSRVLQKMGMSFKRQVKICGKMVDFLIGDNLIVECEGDCHFGYSNLQPLHMTIIRNLTFIISGYKVVLIDIQELNELREKQEELEALLKKKIDLAYQTDIALVS